MVTILRQTSSTETPSAQDIGLGALGWILSDGDRAQRLLSLTGMTPEVLRDGLRDDRILGAVLEFLTGYEPDLIAAAEYLQLEPQAIAAAAEALSR